MGLIATHKNKFILYFNSESELGKQALGYAESSDKDLLAIDVSKTDVPGSHWVEMAGQLNIRIEELLNREHPDFVKEHDREEIDLETHDWLKLLDKCPHLLKYPIAIIGENFVRVTNPSDLKKHISI